LLPVRDNAGATFPPSLLHDIRQQLAAQFGGVTAFTRAPAEGIWAPEAFELGGIELEGPVLIGEGAEIGSGSALTGPLVIGPDCRIGSGARLREAVLTEGASVEPGGYLVSGVLGASSS
jgi:NDP-sugar pyrophosphorylase family protein